MESWKKHEIAQCLVQLGYSPDHAQARSVSHVPFDFESMDKTTPKVDIGGDLKKEHLETELLKSEYGKQMEYLNMRIRRIRLLKGIEADGD